MRRRLLWLCVVIALVGVGAGACRSGDDEPDAGSGSHDAHGAGRGEPTRSTAAPPSLLADGAVPWIDDEMTDADVQNLPPQLPKIDDDAPLCRSDQLHASFPKWYRQAEGGGIYGLIQVEHTSGANCYLEGQPGVSLLLGGRDIGVPAREGGINEAAQKRRVAMIPGEPASLRVDWSPPGCNFSEPDVIQLDLRDGRGTLTVPISEGERARPNCLGGETASSLRSSVAVGTFEAARRAPEPPPSPLNPTVVSVVAPPEIKADDEHLEYRVTITNPTGNDVRLDPCPGYLEELFQLGDMEHEATNTSSLQRLNCQTAPVIAANASMAFQMRVDLPDTVRPGELSVSWRLVGRGVTSLPSLQAAATIRVVP